MLLLRLLVQPINTAKSPKIHMELQINSFPERKKSNKLQIFEESLGSLSLSDKGVYWCYNVLYL